MGKNLTSIPGTSGPSHPLQSTIQPRDCRLGTRPWEKLLAGRLLSVAPEGAVLGATATLVPTTSQPELGANPVSLRPPIRPKGGPMGFFDIPELNIAQKSGGKGWNPANGVPFCARAYICRPRPLGLAGWLCDAGEYLGRP